MAKLEVQPQSWGTRYRFHCLGCNGGHSFDCRTDGGRPSWIFDGDLDRPTFSPSLLVQTSGWVAIPSDRWIALPRDASSGSRAPRDLVGDDCPADLAEVARRLGCDPTHEAVRGRVEAWLDGLPPLTVCHLFLRAGRIQFLHDCRHALAGQTVDLPDL